MSRRYIILSVIIASAAFAQGQTKSADATWITDQPGKHVFFARTVGAIGGDVRFEGAPVKGAPYSAEAVTEVVQKLADGNKIRHENRTTIQRDSEGRTRREETLESVGPWSTAQAHKMIFINDPAARVQYILNPDDKTGRKIPAPDMSNLPIGWSAQADGASADVLIHAAPGGPPPPPPPPPPGTTATFVQRTIIDQAGQRTVESGTSFGGAGPLQVRFNRAGR